jgi:hypothetical protein
MTSGRPHWWAVLSVGIALLALVAAISGSRHPQRVGRALKGATHLGRPSRDGSSGPTVPSSRPLRDVLPSRPSLVATPSIVQPPQPATAVESDPEIATPVPTIPPKTGTFPPGSYQGYFESPWVVSTTYPISDDGSIAATATWSQPVEMTLTVSCLLTSQTETGSSGISVVLTQPETSCSVSLSEPFGSPGTVDYAIEVTS